VRAGRAVTATGLAVAVAGCAGLTPTPAPRAPSRAYGAVAQAQRSHEYPSPGASPQRVTGGAASAVAAIERFAAAYINWSARTVAAQMRALAGQCVGQARTAMALAAAGAAGDYELQRGGVANHGTVEAVARLRGHRNEYVVVTRELTTATATGMYEGLRPAWHVTLASVTPTSGGRWVLSGWQPQS
jgi:hypothetical protein